MRKWSIPVMVIFWLMLVISLPVLQDLLMPPKGESKGVSMIRIPLIQLWMILLALAQAALLLRVEPDPGRPKARRKVWPAVLAASFCFAMLSGSLLLTLSAGMMGDAGIERLSAVGDAAERVLPGRNLDEAITMGLFFAFWLGAWAAWWVMLSRWARTGVASDLIRRWVGWILTGSVLELLVAVPCHIVTRRRDDCCAPLLTFWGMVTGWSLVLLAVGPAVILLVEHRLARKRAPTAPCEVDGGRSSD
jgi:hypothetical protein